MEDVDMLDNNSTQHIPESGNGIATDAPSEAAPPIRKRPKLDLSGFTDPAGSTRKGAERKKGKSIFGVALGTLNKAKVEEKLRMSSEAVSVSAFLGYFGSQLFPCAISRQRNGRKLTHGCRQNLHENKISCENKTNPVKIEFQPYVNKKTCP
jgi:hypothetical protein